MEYVDGRTLRDLLRDDRRLLPERALEITDGVLRALDYSHRNGIVHRDIKPGNVMLTRNGEVKVMDFGIARAVSDAQATMTQTAQVIGTAQYLSPEQARGERVDARSDLYSTGCLLYELLTGRPPFLGDSPVAIAYQHVRENPMPPSRIDPEVPASGPTRSCCGRWPRTPATATSPPPRCAPTSSAPCKASRLPDRRTRRYGANTQRMGPPGANGGQAHRGDRRLPVRPGGGGYPKAAAARRGAGRGCWVGGAALVLAVVGGVAYAVLGGSGSIAVPQVNGSPVKQAEQANKAGLKHKVVDQPIVHRRQGHRDQHQPGERHLVGQGTPVTLFVSSGPKMVAVPDVLHQSVDSARNELQNKGFTGQRGDRPELDGLAEHRRRADTRPGGR